MKMLLNSGLLLLPMLAALSATALAQPPPPAPPPAELTVTVSEMIGRRAEGIATFAAIQKVFTRVFNRRGWPVKINVERFASNNPDHDLELKVYFKDLYYDGRLTLTAWMTLFDHGKEHDFGILKYQLVQGPIEQRDDVFEALLRGEAEQVASKIEPILFPPPGGRAELAASKTEPIVPPHR
jgi:hypothetical protein